MDVGADAMRDGGVDLKIDAENGHRLTVRRSDGSTARYEVVFEHCRNPACACYVVDLVCSPVDECQREATPHVISVDLDRRHVAEDSSRMAQTDLPLARAVVAGMRPDQWRRMRALFTAGKRRAMEETDLDSLDVVFPPGVVDEGLMVAYDEVFPFAEQLVFSVEDQRWLADDQYCVQPGCRCGEVVFAFFSLAAAPESVTDEPGVEARLPSTPVAAVRYHPVRRAVRVESSPPAKPATARKLMEALESSRRDFIEVIRERRRVLRTLFWRDRARRTAERVVAARPKIGRNEPCPCGSGKKHKRCCGR